ncbi:MAG: hypothetical protein A3D87_01270 [Omnitrophica WOR_2 bacterium RIFCSPHIGHO2_02_FULL_50_17]|nr:MAG: hypothetical protein A3D87_01270 [Omnitrophica WOR_2 bacterium RIFCSPHIGHO2_02_FULL_50_17]
MPRMARVVNAGYPHHVIQRGNRRQKVFFCEQDKVTYLRTLKEQSEKYGVQYWAYCLMDNHVHLIAVPQTRESLTKAIGETHRRYTCMINARKGWRGYLWQGRFSSFPLDSSYLYSAVRYVERNPVRVGIVSKAEDYQWSSARAHVKKFEDPILADFYLTKEIPNWKEYINRYDLEEKLKIFRKHIRTGRPLGDKSFIKKLERKLGRILIKQKPGRKPQN